MDLFQGEGAALLIQALLSLRDEAECRAFLEDLMTSREIQDCGPAIAGGPASAGEHGLQPHRPGHRRQQRHHQPGQPVLHLRPPAGTARYWTAWPGKRRMARRRGPDERNLHFTAG